MGMPVSRFSTFYKNGMYHSALNKFKLKVFVLHDPNDRKALSNLRNDFYQLSEETGKELLFVTFFSPVGFREVDSFVCSNETLLCDRSFTEDQMYALRQQLALEHIPFPMMLVTENVDSDDVIVTQLNGTDISNALRILSMRCKEQIPFSKENLETDVRDALCGQLPYEPNIFKKHLDLPLADIMTSYFARELVSKCAGNPILKNSLKEWSEYNEEHLKREMSAERQKEEPDSGRYDRLLIKHIEDKSIKKKILSIRTRGWEDIQGEMLLQEGPRMGFCCRPSGMHALTLQKHVSSYEIEDAYPFSIDESLMKGCERESLRSYRSAKQIFPKNGIDEDFEYTGVALYLNKVIEIELNSSIVQEMRECLGIEMPEYYCKYKEAKQSYKIESQDGKVYDLNAHIDNEWKRLELGPFLGAYSQMGRMKDESEFQMLKYEFKKILYRFYNRRNGPAHYLSMEKEDFIEQCEDFKKLVEFLPELIRRKEGVKSVKN